ncbi:hypothetical protein NL676_002044 [Syzygium grande]|nr:hypothetical protein NL676_002044 [Syzygium grande]
MSKRLEPRSVRDGGLQAQEMDDLERLEPGSTRDGGLEASRAWELERLGTQRTRDRAMSAMEDSTKMKEREDIKMSFCKEFVHVSFP